MRSDDRINGFLMLPAHRFDRFARIPFAVLASGAIFQFAVVLYFYAHFDGAILRLMPDDAFYYLKIAQHISNGFGSVFSVGEPTNGYHPLWMVVLVFTHRITSPSSEQFVLYALVLAVALNLFAARAFARLLRDFGFSETGTLVGMVCYLFLPWMVNITLTGLETPLFFLTLFSFLSRAVKAQQQDVPFTNRDGVLLGLRAGLAMLARVDTIFFTAPIFLGLLITRGRGAVRPLMVAGTCAIVILAPWLLWNWWTFGSIVPSSSGAMSAWRRSYVGPILGWDYWKAGWDVFSYTTYWAVLAPFVRHATYDATLDWWPALLVLLLLIGAAALFHRKSVKKDVKFPAILAVPVIALVGYYCFGRLYVQVWHIATMFVLAIVLTLNFIPRSWTPRRSVSLMLCLLPITVYSLSICYFYPQSGMGLDALRHYRSESPATLRICLPDAGLLGYFSRHTIVNLDGVVNNRALEYILAGRFSQYLERLRCDEVFVSDGRLEFYDRNLPKACRYTFGAGWHDREQDSRGWWKWSSGASTMDVQVQEDGQWTLQAELASLTQPNFVDIIVNGLRVATVEITWAGFQATDVLGMSLRAGVNTVEIVSRNPGWSPPTDQRPLAVALKNPNLMRQRDSARCVLGTR